MNQYKLLDSGKGQKLEVFGEFRIVRPSSVAIWERELPAEEWEKADALFSREDGKKWSKKKPLPQSWQIEVDGIYFHTFFSDFGHMGIFPEHQFIWELVRKKTFPSCKFLNLFAYSGGASLVAAKCGATVCHVDASKPMVEIAKKNSLLNQASNIRWIVEDAVKFIKREKKRGSIYDGILLDPPTFGRGPKKEVFTIEDKIVSLLQGCKEILSPNRSFLILTSHTTSFTPQVLKNLLIQTFGGEVASAELLLPSQESLPLPSGTYAIYEN